MLNEAAVAEYVELCEQLAAWDGVSQDREEQLSSRLDRLWYGEMTSEDRTEAAARLGAKALVWDTECRRSISRR